MHEPDDRERPGVAAGQTAASEALEAQLRLVIEQAPAHLWTTDTQLRVTSVSGSILAQLDVDPALYVGKLLPELAPHVPLAITAHEAALSGENAEYEHAFQGRVFACRVHPLRGTQGDVVGCIGLALDITERKKVEQRLAIEYAVNRVLSEAATLQDAAPQVLRVIGEGLGWDCGAFWTVDRDDHVLRCEETWSAPSADVAAFMTATRAAAFAKGEGLPGSVWASGEPRWVVDIAAESRFPRLQVAATEGLRSGFGLPVRLNGWIVAVIEFLSRQTHQPDPAVLEMVTVLSSALAQFTLRKRAEETLRARVDQQQVVAAFGEYALATPDLAAVMDEAVAVVARTLHVEYCKILEVLPGDEALLLRAGIGWGDAVGRATVPTGADSQGGYTLLVDGPVISSDIRVETRFRPPPLLLAHGVVSSMSVVVPGRLTPFGVLQADATSPRVFSDDDAAFLRAVATLLATALRRKEFEERLAHEHAEAFRLEAQERARGEFLAAISHDLKTPLTAAQFGIGMVEMSATERLRPEERELLKTTLRSIHRLGFLIDDLLAYNRLAADSLRLDREPLDVREVVATALPAVHLLMQRKAQTLTVDLPAALPVRGDAQRLEQVIVNLLSNAHTHTPAGTRITVAGGVVDGEVQLSVADTGPGIASEELEEIFRRFYRPHETPSPGSGLGLAIARELAELHGGRIWAESTPGLGAIFHLALPVREDEPARAP